MTFDLKQALDANQIRALIFDMDGTLVDNMGFHHRTWIEWAHREGLAGSNEYILSQTHGTIREITRRLFPDEDDATRFARGERKEALYREIYRPHLRLIPGLAELLENAKKAGLPMAVATAGDRTNIDFTLDGLNVRSYFKAIIGAEDVKNGKPDPEVFLQAAQKLSIDPANCLVFEDSTVGAEAARRAGMSCIVVNPTSPLEEYVDALHVLHFARDYEELLWHPDA